MAISKVPITVVSGFKGAGKTSLIESLRAGLRSKRVAFLQDDGEGDLFGDIETAVDMEGNDQLVIECASNLEPYYVAEHLVQGDEEEPPPGQVRLDTLVTVVDSSRFMADVLKGKDLAEFDLAFDEDDDRSASEVLVEQVEFADVIVLNKVDLMDESSLNRLEALIERLNPRAKRIRAIRGQIEASEVICTRLFDMFETDDGAGWLAEFEGVFSEIGEVSGVTSFTFTERRPFHPIRFNELIAEFKPNGLVRAKGSVWVATRHHEIGVWSAAGPSSVLTYGGAWFAATPAREWPPDERDRAEIMRIWVPPFGDRRQEIAFIGVGMSEAEIRERLEECLLTSDEMVDGPDSWFKIPDPLPDWHLESDTEF